MGGLKEETPELMDMDGGGGKEGEREEQQKRSQTGEK